MERNKYPYLNIGKKKETKNIRINLKDNSSYTSDSVSNQTKNAPNNLNNKKIIKDIKKNLVKNDTLKPSQSCTELKSHPTDKKAGLNSKTNTTSFIEEKRIKYIPSKSKNRSMEKIPSSTIGSNKKDWKRNKNNGDKHHSCGKNSDYNKYNKTETKKNIRINKKNFNTIEYNNIDDLQNININEEQSFKNRNKNKKNNYLNYIINDSKVNTDPNLITKSDLDDTEEDNPYSFQEYNSFCVRINNNYNYNVSLGNNSDFMNQTFDKKKDDIQIKSQGKQSEWKEKITKINKQKNDINYGDYKKAKNKDNNLKKTKKIGNKEEKNVSNKSIDSNNTSLNLRQKIKKLNSAVIPGESDKKMNASDTEANTDKKNEPKKYTGILGFLRSFKDMVKPFNMRKKVNYESDSDNSNNSSIENPKKIDIKEKVNKSDSNNIINESKKRKNIFNFLNTNENNSNNVNANNTSKKPENKANVYEKKSISKKPEDYNYYSDSGYESSPLPHKPKNLNMYSTPNINTGKHRNIYETKNNQQILSYSQKNILQINNKNENELYEGKRNKQISDIVDRNYNDFKTEEKQKGNNLFNLYGIFNNKLYQKNPPSQSNKTNSNLINNFYRNNINIPKQINDNFYNSAYVKKTKKIFPSINNNSDAISEKEIRKYSFHNNNTAYNLDNIDNEYMNNPIMNEVNDTNKYDINENLNINAEKKIQEIKININYKGDNNNFGNTLTPMKNQKSNYNNNIINNYNVMDDFIDTPKTKSEIETCVINFKQNKKPMKVYENNLYNNTSNINDNILNNNNFSLYKNNTNIKDINSSNSKNIYSKPMGKNLNFSQGNSLSEKNIMEGKKENILSYSDTNIAINRNSFDSPKPSLKKNILRQNEKIVNRLANSQQFDNDTNSVNSSSSNELNKTTIFPSSNITNSIYFKPFKYFFGGNKNKTNNSANNSFSSTLFKKDIINNGNLSDRESSTNSGLNKIIYFTKKNKTSQLNKNENNLNQNNPEQIIYKKSNSNKNNNFKINLLNSSNNNNVITINNVTPMPDNTNYKVTNIKTIIRPKVIQKKTEFIEKYYSYYLKNPMIENKECFYSKEFIKIKILKMPLKKICFCTKSFYKIIQKPKVAQKYIDKKRISHKAISLPIIQNCSFTKESIIKQIFSQIYDNKYSTPNQKKEKREQNLTPKFMNNNQKNSSNKDKNKIISIEIDLNNKNKYVKKNKDMNNEENVNVVHNLGSSYNKIHLNTIANEPLYIKKTPNNNNFKQNNNNNMNNNNNINNFYVHTEDDNFKTYLKERMNDSLKINKFFSDDFNINNNSNRPNNNKIISIDIDLRKEQKKLHEPKEIKTYKKPTPFKPLIDQNQNLKKKINTIKINLNKNSTKSINTINKNANININDKYVNNLNIDKLRQEIIYKLDIIEESNLMIIMDELVDLLTKKVIINNINDDINLNKIRLSFIEIINNAYLFVEIIINKVIVETQKVDIYAHICYEMSMRMNNEVSFGGNGSNEDLKTILQESCKIKFEEIVSNDINIKDNKNNLLGIIMFICELINYKIIFLDIGFLCFEKICNKYNDSFYDSGKLNRYYYLDLIINILNKIGKNAYQTKDLKYKEKIDNYIDNELNNLISNDMDLPEYLRNKIISLIKTKNNNWNF